eukprot:jgi/Ulvmu1/2775/UM140_0004.1
MSPCAIVVNARGSRASHASRAGTAPPRSEPVSATLDRRALLAALTAAPLAATPADALDLPFFGKKGPKPPPNVVRDDTLAYTFTYPLQTADGVAIPITTSRKPEKYSSAAPLTADARQRIVSQYVSLADGITMTVYVGPATGALAGADPAQWRPKDVATTVLTDRSASRNTQGQRVPLASLESIDTVDRNGQKYYVYETVQQGSPNLYDASKDTQRVALCVTAARPGLTGTQYLYTLALSAPGKAWSKLESGFKETAESFQLLPPGKGYVPPDKDPWLFF